MSAMSDDLALLLARVATDPTMDRTCVRCEVGQRGTGDSCWCCGGPTVVGPIETVMRQESLT